MAEVLLAFGVLCFPVAIVVAAIAGDVFRGRRADRLRCFGCGYSLAGLSSVALCPECDRSRKPVEAASGLSDWFPVYFGIGPLIVACVAGAVAGPIAFGFVLLAWGLSSVFMGCCIYVASRSLPKRQLTILSTVVLCCVAIGSALTVGDSLCIHYGVAAPSEIGASYEVAIDAGIAGPALTTMVGLWLFSILTVYFMVARTRARRTP